MKFTYILPLAALSTAFVLPEQHLFSELAVETHRTADSAFDKLPSREQLVDKVEHSFEKLTGKFDEVVKCSKHALDSAIDYAAETGNDVTEKVHKTGFEASSWLDSNAHLGLNDHHHNKPNQTIYQLISTSKYTTKLAAAINEYPDLVVLLNGTIANYTVFAPIDSAFDKIPDKAPKPSKEFLKNVLLYHVSPEYYPAGKVLVTHTVPTALTVDTVGIGPQRVSTNIGLKGLTVNFYARIIAIDIVNHDPLSSNRQDLTINSSEPTESSMALIAYSFHPQMLSTSSNFSPGSSAPWSSASPKPDYSQ